MKDFNELCDVVTVLDAPKALHLMSKVQVRLMDLAASDMAPEIQDAVAGALMQDGYRLRFTTDTLPYRIKAELVAPDGSTTLVFDGGQSAIAGCVDR